MVRIKPCETTRGESTKSWCRISWPNSSQGNLWNDSATRHPSVQGLPVHGLQGGSFRPGFGLVSSLVCVIDWGLAAQSLGSKTESRLGLGCFKTCSCCSLHSCSQLTVLLSVCFDKTRLGPRRGHLQLVSLYLRSFVARQSR